MNVSASSCSSSIQPPAYPIGGFDVVQTSLTDAPWYAVAVIPRHEKKVHSYLRQRGIATFLPVYRSVRRWKDRNKVLDLALFPGYLFVNLDLRDRLSVLQSPGVMQFVSFQGRPTPVADREIRTLMRSAESGIQTSPHPYLSVGRKVRVVCGPMAGVEGILKRRKDCVRLVISIDLIKRSVMLEVDESDVEAL